MALAGCSSAPTNAAASAPQNGAVPTATQSGGSSPHDGAAPTATSSGSSAHHNGAPTTAIRGLKVQDRSHDNDNPDNTLYALYQITNTGTAAVPLTSLTMRYWFTNESPNDPLVFACDWAQVTCGNISARFVALSSPVSGANTYLEISFKAGTGGSLAPGQNTGEIQTRVHHANWSNFNTTQSYSFISDPSFVYKDTQTVTLYQSGTLIWGVEPKA
jgi:hypothetical protein